MISGRAFWYALLVGASVASASAQHIRHAVDGKDVVEVQLTSYAGSAQTGGLGFVHVEAVNNEGRPHALQVEFASRSYAGNSVEARRTLALGPFERGRFYMPLPGLSRYQFELIVTVDATRHYDSLQPSRNRGGAVLLISDRPHMEPPVLSLTKGLWPDPKGNTAEVVTCDARATPDDWRLMTGFNLVVVDGMTRVERETQEAVRRLAHAGGRVLVIAPDRLPPGALRERLESIDSIDTVREGLGVLTGARTLSTGSSRLLRELKSDSGNTALWPLDADVQAEQIIPGLDRAPVLVFLFVILLFAVMVGPVNFYLLRKARRPMLALVTVPAIGFGTTLLMFGYAIINDGFGVRGVVRSWTLLDQVNHEAASIATRTLFAGLTPGNLALGDDTLVVSPAAFQRPDYRSRHRWSFDGDTGLLGGGVVPARTPTVITSARQGVTRDRLRAQVRSDGDIDLLTDGGVVPIGDVLLRDADGRYWYGQSPRLSPCSSKDAGRAMDRMQRAFRLHEVVRRRGTEIVSLDRLTHSLLGDGLAKGSYVTKVQRAPWVPDHGLAVDYEAEEHFVVGRMGVEDFIQ